MLTRHPTSRAVMLIAIAALILPSTAARADTADGTFADGAVAAARVTVQHIPDERRLVITVGPLHSQATSAECAAVARMPQVATLYRGHAELVDDSGTVLDSVAWGVTLFAQAPLAESWEGASAMARLNSGHPGFSLPRPYGVQLGENDSLMIVAAFPPSAGRRTVLRITLEYEAQPATRLAAVAVAPQESVSTGSWTWRADVGGRLVAFVGPQLLGAEALALEDVTTGREVWSQRMQFPVDERGAQLSEVVRLGVTLEEGRLYRLRAVYPRAAVPAQLVGGDTPLAIVLPARTR